VPTNLGVLVTATEAPNSSSLRVTVVIPALNEARNLPHVFARMPKDVHEVILVDGNSLDDTIETARRLWPDVRIVRQTRAGKGNALACGIAAATGEVIAMVDADGSADPGEIPAFVAALRNGAEFAKGSRFVPGGASDDITVLRSIGNRFLTTIFNFCYRKHYSDLCYGFNVFWRRYAPVLNLDVTPANGERQWGDGFEIETVIHVRVARAGLAVTEVPSHEHARIHGVSNLNAVSDGCRVLGAIFTEWRRSRAAHAAGPAFAAGKPRHTFRGFLRPGGRHERLSPNGGRVNGRVIGALGASTAAASLVVWGLTFSAAPKPGSTTRVDHLGTSTNRLSSTKHNPAAVPKATSARIFGTANWQLKFHPTFLGTHLNHSVWDTCYPWALGPAGCTNFGHHEFEWYLPGQDRVSNGLLYLVAQHKRTIGTSPTGQRLVYGCRSGMVTTFHSFQFEYGIVQIKARIPSNFGMWPAFWLAASSEKFPPEVDILEHWSRPVRPTGVFLHTVNGADVAAWPQTANLSVGWHTFTLRWTRQGMSWFIDGRRVLHTYHTVRQSMYFIANLAEFRDPFKYGCGGSVIIRSLKIWQAG
jgi:hypothetical protein